MLVRERQAGKGTDRQKKQKMPRTMAQDIIIELGNRGISGLEDERRKEWLLSRVAIIKNNWTSIRKRE